MKRKIIITRVVSLVIWLTALGHYYAPQVKEFKGCGHATWRVQHPPPAISVEAVKEEEAIQAAVKSLPTLELSGKEVVTVTRLDRTPEEWAQIDQRTSREAEIRRFYNIHEPR